MKPFIDTGLNIAFATDQVADRRNKGWSEDMIRQELLGCILSDAKSVIIPMIPILATVYAQAGETKQLIHLLQFVAAIDAIHDLAPKKALEMDTLEFATAMDKHLDEHLARAKLHRGPKPETSVN